MTSYMAIDRLCGRATGRQTWSCRRDMKEGGWWGIEREQMSGISSATEVEKKSPMLVARMRMQDVEVKRRGPHPGRLGPEA